MPVLKLILLSFSFLFFQPAPASEFKSAEYFCKVHDYCLPKLQALLDKNHPTSVYQTCHTEYSQNQDCCLNPFTCNKPYTQYITASLSDTFKSLGGQSNQNCSTPDSRFMLQVQNLQHSVCRDSAL